MIAFFLRILLKILLLSAAYFTVFAAEFCPPSAAENSDHQKLLEIREAKLTTFANSPPVSSQADQMLEILLKKKSPVLINWLKRRDLSQSSDKDITNAWRLYFAEHLIIRNYKNKSEPIKTKIENLIEEVYAEAFPTKKKKSFEKLFSEAKDISIRKIEKLKIDDDLKTHIKNRIQTIKLYWLEKLATSSHADRPLEVFSWGIAYSPVANQINIGLDALKYENESTVFAVFAHEIGHAFDPCRWGAFFDGDNPFSEVVSCLRNPKSIGAKQRDDSKLQQTFKAGELSLSLKTALEMNPYCNKIEYPPIGVQADQINEAFADWFSAEVLSDSEMLKKGLRQDLCFEKKLNPGSSYPQNIKRLLGIYLAHPKIKEAFKAKLSTTPLYCSYELVGRK